VKIICENCGHEQNINTAAVLGKEGGKKSKRVLTPEQAKAMVEVREKKKREK
jgi:Spy/CpxP family protein refolding chaperone